MIEPQLAKHLYDALALKTPKTIGVEYAIFEKFDGWHGRSDGAHGIVSRAGRRISSVEHLLPLLEHQYRGTLIFEIMVAGSPDFATTNGMLNRQAPAKDAYLMVHDFISADAPKVAFKHRYSAAQSIVNRIGHSRIKLAPILSVGDTDAIQACAQSVWERGGEGAIGKAYNEPYAEGKRDHTLIKVKEDITLDLLVVGVSKGAGKYENMLGTLVVQEKNGNKHFISGMTDAQRVAWWEHPNLIVGCIVEVRAMRKLKDGGLREARLKAIRHDKNKNEID